jgi:phosphopantothenoylcysteine decarboxylase/phosphopantothenate--cysteine ligase
MTGEDVGVGRYPEVGRLVSEVSKFLELNSDFSHRKILVTAGGTRENIDPVRFIGNRSSGKQGLAIAEAARNRGAKVTLIGANISLPIPQGINYIPVQTTSDLSDALDREFPTCDALFMAAAVADAKPIASSDTKIKKADLNSISLEKNADLLATISKTKKAGQIVVGFSAETGDIDQQEASRKLEAKGLDVIYTNDVSGGAIFGSENTSGWILSTGGLKTEVLEIKKETLANQLLDIVKTKLG